VLLESMACGAPVFSCPSPVGGAVRGQVRCPGGRPVYNVRDSSTGLERLSQTLAIAAGGAIGALMRFWVSSGVYALLGKGFPLGTLVVNVLGSLAMGFLYVVLLERMAAGPEVRAALLIGLLGAFTTFSTFSMETVNLIEQAELVKAGLNVLVSMTACLLAAWLGLVLGRLS
jgi:CrcB protein